MLQTRKKASQRQHLTRKKGLKFYKNQFYQYLPVTERVKCSQLHLEHERKMHKEEKNLVPRQGGSCGLRNQCQDSPLAFSWKLPKAGNKKLLIPHTMQIALLPVLFNQETNQCEPCDWTGLRSCLYCLYPCKTCHKGL